MAKFDRRDFLALTASLGLGVGCGGANAPIPPGPAPSPSRDLWKAAQASVRQSPDHLAARADDAVATKDAKVIFDFVRGHVVLLPGNLSVSGMPHWEVRTGPRGTLRGGAGTAMEIAFLLSELLSRAGLEATPMHIREDLSPERVEALLFTPPARSEALGEIRGVDLPPASPVALNRVPDEVAALRDALLAPLDADTIGKRLGKPRDLTWKGGTPAVELKQGDEKVLLNPFVPNGYGYRTDARVLPLREGKMRKVSLALMVATSANPTNPRKVAEATYTTEQLAGRQVTARMEPALPPSALLGLSPDDVSLFLPTLHLQAIDGGETPPPAVGDPLHTSGASLTMDEAGEVTFGGKAYEATKSDALARVAKLEATVDASRFGDVHLRLIPRDAKGEVVAGLGAGDFVVKEEDALRLHVMRSNAVSPKITFLVDSSLSMPADYRGDQGKAFFDGLANELRALLPGANVETRFTTSQIWTFLTKAADDGPSLIVYATDGHVDDKPTPAMLRSLRAGPKTVIVDVTGKAARKLDAVAAASNGQRVAATDPEAFERAVLAAAANAPPRGYDVTYDARSQGPPKRRVAISTGDGRLQQNLTYTVPPAAERAVGETILGLYLQVQVGSRTSITPIAGLPFRSKVDETQRRRAAEEARWGLFATTIVSFEAGMPSRTQLVDDFLTAGLTKRDFRRALDEGQLDDVMGSDQLKDFPQELCLLQGPLSCTYGAKAVAFPETLRAVAIITDIDPKVGTRRRADLIPVLGWNSLSADPETSFRHTLTATAELARYEGTFATSTAGLLEGKPLERLFRTKHPLKDEVDPFVAATYARAMLNHDRDHKVGVPGMAAFFAIDPKTGRVLGLLPDGTRGGSNTKREEDLIVILSHVLAILARIGNVGAVGGTALGIVAIYGKHLVRMYGAVSTAIANMDAENLNDEIKAVMASLACEIVIAIMVAPFGKGLGSALNRLLKTIGLNPCAAI